MDSRTFDELTKSIATNTTRRQTLKTIVAGIVGGALALGGSSSSLALPATSHTADPASCCDTSDSLWQRINARAADCHNNKSHCSNIDLQQGYALSPANAPNLLVATKCTTGIECSTVWLNNTPNYWNLAWVHLASSQGSRAAMAINAQHTKSGTPTRTQNQLHIHVGHISASVMSALDGFALKALPNWSVETIEGRQYRVAFLANNGDLANNNLFAVVHNTVGTANMQYETLIVAKRQKGGFYILNSDTAILASGVSDGERLLV